MKAEIIIDHHSQQVKLILDWKTGKIGQRLTADEAENVAKLIEQKGQEASREAFKQWLLQFECDEDVIVVDGKKYRFKMVAEKEFLTKFGPITVPRRIYQQDLGGKIHVPLDIAWNMHGEFMTRDVRECVLYMNAFMLPNEIQECLEKTSAFQPSRTAIQNVVNEMGEHLEQYEDALLNAVRENESLPVEKAKAFVVSLDRKMESLLLERDDGALRIILSLEYYLNAYEYKDSSRSLSRVV